MLQGVGTTGDRARNLRQDMSLPEVRLWQILRTRPGGAKFRRQHPSGPFVADFYCHEVRLVIEIDGKAHGRGDRPDRDAVRDRWFAARGLKVLRLPAAYVLANLDGAVVAIVAAVEQRRR